MINPFQTGDIFLHTVTQEDAARFPTGEVHNVYSTFALARDAEWAGRLFVLEMKETDEEGIGTAVTVSHHSPALIGETVTITSTLGEVKGNEIITPYEAKVGDRLVASGETKQKILKKEKLDRLFQSLRPA
jgi:fluoroacetyl-CoA thioesterase